MVLKWFQKRLPRWNILHPTTSNKESHKQELADLSPKDKKLAEHSIDAGNSSRTPSTSQTSTNTTPHTTLKPEEQQLKARLNSGKVFPSHRSASKPLHQPETSRASQLQAVEEEASVPPALATSSSSVKVRRLKCLFKMLRTPSKWKWRWSSHSHHQAPRSNRATLKHKPTNLRKLLVKIQNRAWFTCPLYQCNTTNHSTNSLPRATIVQVSTRPHQPPPQQSVQHVTHTCDSVEKPLAPYSPGKLSIDASDPEYWIKTDSDYVVLVVSNDTKPKK